MAQVKEKRKAENIKPQIFTAQDIPQDATEKIAKSAGRGIIGMNLSGIADWNTELPFVDTFRLSRRWISQESGKGWAKGPELDIDDRGWLRSLPEGEAFAQTLIMNFRGHKIPGDYLLIFNGSGEVGFKDKKVNMLSEGRGIVRVSQDESTLFLDIKKTDPSDPVRDIRLIMPGHHDNWEKQIFRPGFIEQWQDMECFRFMDWMRTNGSKISQWSDRPVLEDATWTGKGVPLEIMVELSNRAKVSPWFCMPHLADDDYVREFAKFARDNLDKSLKIYIEYSNECWNGMFEQSKYVNSRGVEAGLSEKERPWEAGWRWYAQRSVEIFKMWEDVFGGRERLVRVLASQAANSHVTRRILEWKDAASNADALAIAPYMSMNIPRSTDREGALDATVVSGWSVERILDHVEQSTLPESIEKMHGQKMLAEEFGLRLICYEGGQHLVGVRGGENDETMTQKFHEANRHKRMGDIYRKYLDVWKEISGDLFCHFSSVGMWSKWGSWGLTEYHDETTPKMETLLEWDKNNRK